MKLKELTNFNKRYTIELEAPRFGDAYHAGQVVRGAIVIWRKNLVTDSLLSGKKTIALLFYSLNKRFNWLHCCFCRPEPSSNGIRLRHLVQRQQHQNSMHRHRALLAARRPLNTV